MFVSVFDLFSIGIGPSSSHTVGPMRAAKTFAKLIKNKCLDKLSYLKIDLYGSLAATGKGHGTDKAIFLGLEGEDPETVVANNIQSRVEQIIQTKIINLLAEKKNTLSRR